MASPDGVILCVMRFGVAYAAGDYDVDEFARFSDLVIDHICKIDDGREA